MAEGDVHASGHAPAHILRAIRRLSSSHCLTLKSKTAMTSMTTKLLGAVLGVSFFAAIGMAMANATIAETHTAKAEITKTKKVAGLVGVCQVRRCD
jgi:hypothetical protein